MEYNTQELVGEAVEALIAGDPGAAFGTVLAACDHANVSHVAQVFAKHPDVVNGRVGGALTELSKRPELSAVTHTTAAAPASNDAA
ncbi:MAG TPA: hypothetical protein VLG40_00445 [Candidatus Saccharimonas sp.]|nr:hypothetical protein [Candidatus Saccharimonas sp.]